MLQGKFELINEEQSLSFQNQTEKLILKIIANSMSQKRYSTLDKR